MILPKKLLCTAFAAAAMTALCMAGASAASLGIGTVQIDGLCLREEANTEAGILNTAAEGDAVIVLEDDGNGWYKVDYGTVTGYMSGEYLTVAETADINVGYGIVRTGGDPLNVRTGPDTSFDKVVTLSSGTVVNIVGIENGWFKIVTSGGSVGYVSSDYMVACDASGLREDTPVSSLGQQIVDYAMQYLGCPYVYGGNGPSSFDCSGFTSYVYRHFGYTINRTASTQLSNGISVSQSELQPGDLVFFRANTTKAASHVGIYIGNGMFIHASTNTYTVKTDSLYSNWYSSVYVGARRIQ